MPYRDLFHHLHHEERARYDRMFPVLWAFACLLAGTALMVDAPRDIMDGLGRILRCEDALITDYVLVGGLGAALMNSAIVTAITVAVLYVSRDVLNGMTLVELGLMSGFSLFGKNFLNIWPILLGSWLYARYRKEPAGGYVGIGLMATALAPVVSYIGLDNGWGDPIFGLIVGVAIGFVMPPLTMYTYKIQNGMNLYNVGFACGLVALICVPLMSSLGAEPALRYRWATGYNMVFSVMLFSPCGALVLLGLFGSGKPAWASWAGYRRLLQTSGRAPSDYLRMFGPGPVMINTGVNGMIGTLFILMAGGDLNGPTVGGILTIMGFSAFGKHALNILPVMSGVVLGSIVMHWYLSDSAVQLACLFCTTLAPIAGYFGWQYGVLAGFLHASVVLYTSSPVAGLNLYNNGFSGGLVAIVLYPAIVAIARHRKPVIQDEDYLDQLEQDSPTTPPTPHQILEEEDR